MEPSKLGLKLYIRQPSSEDFLYEDLAPDVARRNKQQDVERADADGLNVDYHVGRMMGMHAVEVSVRQGADTPTVLAMLRKAADLLEKHGRAILDEPLGSNGEFRNGAVIPGEREGSADAIDEEEDDEMDQLDYYGRGPGSDEPPTE